MLATLRGFATTLVLTVMSIRKFHRIPNRSIFHAKFKCRCSS